jgi:serine/threonine protein phosphatase PrpC
MRFSIYQESKKGGRKSNQDRMGYCFTRDALLMIVADGMGGHVQGDIAAQIAVQTVGRAFQEQALPMLKSPSRFLESTMLDAHQQILDYRTANRLSESPRTTIVACVVQDGAAFWAHVGDSRLYWIRGGEIVAQTRDHSKIQSMILKGLASPADIDTHPDRNKLFNCLGSPEPPTVELSRKMALKPGDTLFLCTDGLWSAVDEQAISSAFASSTVMRAVPDLITAALTEARNDADNVTAMAMSWAGSESRDEQGVSTAGMPMGAITTTIDALRPGRADASQQAPMTDSEIERAIADIRASIRKSNRLMPKV